jgi:hypothetical protein
VRAVLHALGTFVDKRGYAWPSQATIARAACMSTRAVQKALQCAERERWIGRHLGEATGQAWRRHGYRCCVPDHVDLTKYSQLADAFEAIEGAVTVPEGGEPRSPRQAPDTQKVANDTPEGGERHARRWRTTFAKVANHVRTNSVSELCSKNSAVEGRALARADRPDDCDSESGSEERNGGVAVATTAAPASSVAVEEASRGDPRPTWAHRALLKRAARLSDARIAADLGVTVDAVRAVLGEQA